MSNGHMGTPVNRQTQVKTLPSPQLRWRAVMNKRQLKALDNQLMNEVQIRY